MGRTGPQKRTCEGGVAPPFGWADPRIERAKVRSHRLREALDVRLDPGRGQIGPEGDELVVAVVAQEDTAQDSGDDVAGRMGPLRAHVDIPVRARWRAGSDDPSIATGEPPLEKQCGPGCSDKLTGFGNELHTEGLVARLLNDDLKHEGLIASHRIEQCVRQPPTGK